MSDIFCPVIPVLDIMIGRVVWAQKGQRHKYRPLDSKLIADSDPTSVAKAVFNQTGCRWLYVADIDSFAGANPNWSVFESLIQAGFKLLIDADWTAPRRLEKAIATFTGSQNVKLIISTETLESVQQFDIFERLLENNIDACFSIDMQGDQVIAKTPAIATLSPLQLAHEAYRKGVRNLILLDLETVGTGEGIQSDHSIFNRQAFLTEIANELEDVKLISGGGVGDHSDCQAFLSSGCQHVLAASAIFDCRITPDEIALLQPFRNYRKTRAAFIQKS